MEFQELSNMLQNEGFSKSVVNTMLNEEYHEFDNVEDLKKIYMQNGNFQNILQNLADGYSMEELSSLGVQEENIQTFLEYLKANNSTIGNAKAINQYSNVSNMILSLRRGLASREEIKDGIMSDLANILRKRRNIKFRRNKRFCIRTRLFKTCV